MSDALGKFAPPAPGNKAASGPPPKDAAAPDASGVVVQVSQEEADAVAADLAPRSSTTAPRKEFWSAPPPMPAFEEETEDDVATAAAVSPREGGGSSGTPLHGVHGSPPVKPAAAAVPKPGPVQDSAPAGSAVNPMPQPPSAPDSAGSSPSPVPAALRGDAQNGPTPEKPLSSQLHSSSSSPRSSPEPQTAPLPRPAPPARLKAGDSSAPVSPPVASSPGTPPSSAEGSPSPSGAASPQEVYEAQGQAVQAARAAQRAADLATLSKPDPLGGVRSGNVLALSEAQAALLPDAVQAAMSRRAVAQEERSNAALAQMNHQMRSVQRQYGSTVVLGGSSWGGVDDSEEPGPIQHTRGSNVDKLVFSSPPVPPLYTAERPGEPVVWSPPEAANSAAHSSMDAGPRNSSIQHEKRGLDPAASAAAEEDAAFLRESAGGAKWGQLPYRAPSPRRNSTAVMPLPRPSSPVRALVGVNGAAPAVGNNSNQVVDVAVAGAGLRSAGSVSFAPAPTDALQLPMPRSPTGDSSTAGSAVSYLREAERIAMASARSDALVAAAGEREDSESRARRLEWEASLASLQSQAGELEALSRDLGAEVCARDATRQLQAEASDAAASPGSPGSTGRGGGASVASADASGRLFDPEAAPPTFPTRHWRAHKQPPNPVLASRLASTGVAVATRLQMEREMHTEDSSSAGTSIGGRPVHPHVAHVAGGVYLTQPQAADKPSESEYMQARTAAASQRGGSDAGANPIVLPPSAMMHSSSSQRLSPSASRALVAGRLRGGALQDSLTAQWLDESPLGLQQRLGQRMAEAQERAVAASAVLLGSSGPHGPAEGHVSLFAGVNRLLASDNEWQIPQAAPGTISLTIAHVLHAVWRSCAGMAAHDLRSVSGQLRLAMAEMGAVEYDIAASVGRRLGQEHDDGEAVPDGARAGYRMAQMGFSPSIRTHGKVVADMSVQTLKEYADAACDMAAEMRGEGAADEAVGTPAVTRALTGLATVLEREARGRTLAAVNAVQETLQRLRAVRRALQEKVSTSTVEEEDLSARRDKLENEMVELRASVASMRQRSDTDFSAVLLGIAQQSLGLVPWDSIDIKQQHDEPRTLTDYKSPSRLHAAGADSDVPPPPPPPPEEQLGQGGAAQRDSSSAQAGTRERPPAPETIATLALMARAACSARQLPSVSLASSQLGLENSGIMPIQAAEVAGRDLLGRADPQLRTVVDWLTMPNTEFLRTADDRRAAALAAGEADAAARCEARYSGLIERQRAQAEAETRCMQAEAEAAVAELRSQAGVAAASPTGMRLKVVNDGLVDAAVTGERMKARCERAGRRTARIRSELAGLARLESKKAQVRVLLQSSAQRLMAVRNKVSSLVRKSTERLGIDSDILEYFSLLRTVVSPEYRLAFLGKTLQAAPYSKPLHTRLQEISDGLIRTAAENAEALQRQSMMVAKQRQEAARAAQEADERAGIRGTTSPTGHWRGKLLQYRSTEELHTPLPSGVRLFNPDSPPGSPERAGASRDSKSPPEEKAAPHDKSDSGIGRSMNVRDRLADYIRRHPTVHDDSSPESAGSAASAGVQSAVGASRAIRKQAAMSRVLFK